MIPSRKKVRASVIKMSKLIASSSSGSIPYAGIHGRESGGGIANSRSGDSSCSTAFIAALALQRLPRIASNTGLQSLKLADPTDVSPWSFRHLTEYFQGHKMPREREIMTVAALDRNESGTLAGKPRYLSIIFDFDGTIADTLSAIVRLVNEHAHEFNIQPLEEKDVEELRGMSNLDIIKKFKVPLVKVPYLVLRAQKELNQRMDEVQLFPGVRELVLELKACGFRIGILTSNSRENVLKFLRGRQLDVFDFIHTEQNFFGKNWALLHLLKKFDLKKEETIYVGDEIRDIEACHKVNVPVIAVGWGFHRRHVLAAKNPTFIVDSASEILDIVAG